MQEVDIKKLSEEDTQKLKEYGKSYCNARKITL